MKVSKAPSRKRTRKKRSSPLKRVISSAGRKVRGKKETAAKAVLKEPAVTLKKEEEKMQGVSFFFEKPQKTEIKETVPGQASYSLPVRYNDNRIVLLARDPWWLYTYWDISENKINEVISSIPVHERQNLRWALRVYDVSGVRDFRRDNANWFFDVEVNFDVANWYINVQEPEHTWCVEIGFKSPEGKFFHIARSNIIKTPYFGISSLVDEEWALSDEEYFKILGVYDLGKSSLQIKKRVEEIFKQQISSPLASWGMSSLFSERARVKDKFFLEVATELILYGRTEADAQVAVGSKKIKLRRDGTFSLRYALPPGDFKFEVTARSKNKKHKIKKTPAVKRYNK